MVFLLLFLLNSSWSLPPQKLWFASHCSLYSPQESRLLRFPGYLCEFLADGKIVSASNTSLSLLASDDTLVWRKDGWFHHCLTVTAQGKILILESDFSADVRADVLKIFDLSGNLLAQRNVRDFLPAEVKPLDWPISKMPRPPGIDREISHFNSLYEIPEVQGKVPDWMRPGNIIANGLEQGIFVFSPDLKELIFHALPSRPWIVHDVQITRDGKILLFNNWLPGGFSSAIEKLDPFSLKPVWQWPRSPTPTFYSATMGSVQELAPSVILFTHMLNGTFILNAETGELTWSSLAFHFQSPTLVPVQKAKAGDYESFLMNRKDP